MECSRRKLKPEKPRQAAARPNPEGPPESRPYFWPEEANYPGYTGPGGRRSSLETQQKRQLPYYLLLLALFSFFILLSALLHREGGSLFTADWEEINLLATERASGSVQAAETGPGPSDLDTSQGTGPEPAWPLGSPNLVEVSRPDSDGTALEPDLPIYISGAVKHPGVYYLAPGSLLVDLVDQAGGFTDREPPPDLNLAASLQAHAHVHVAGSAELASGSGSHVTYEGEYQGLGPGPGAQAAGGQSGLISLNQASQEELEMIPGIGPKTAQAILRLRADLDRDLVLEDLLTIPGIKEKRFDQIKSYFCLP